MRNLSAVYGSEQTPDEIQALCKEVFRRSGANVISSIKTATMPAEKIRKCLTIEGLDELDELQHQDKGVIAVIAHMGNWEVLTQVGQFASPKQLLGALYRPLNNPHLDALVKRRRQSQKTTLFSRKDKLGVTSQHLKKGGVLGILTDQRIGRHGVLVPFFGRVTSYTPLPNLLHRRTGCNLIGISVITDAPGKWTVRYMASIKSDAKSNSADIAHITETIMRESPADCFWMHDRWKIQVKPFHRPSRKPFQGPLLSSYEINPLRFGIVIDSVDQIDLTLRVAEKLLSQQDDLNCLLFVDSTVSLETLKPERLPERVSIVPATGSLTNSINESDTASSIYLMLNWGTSSLKMKSAIPQFQMNADQPFEEIIDHLGANRIDLGLKGPDSDAM
tara:strand:+ start:1948 stop:3117 length:1170 start_codon:yes stop_codon:yes gene_type:complete